MSAESDSASDSTDIEKPITLLSKPKIQDINMCKTTFPMCTVTDTVTCSQFSNSNEEGSRTNYSSSSSNSFVYMNTSQSNSTNSESDTEYLSDSSNNNHVTYCQSNSEILSDLLSEWAVIHKIKNNAFSSLLKIL